MRVLVTGGCGYVGSALVPALQAEPSVEHVTVLDALTNGSPANLRDAAVADGFDFHRGDVRDQDAVERAVRGSDAIAHLAAITGAAGTHDRPDETYAVNFDGTRTVLEAALEHGIDRVVFASSCNVYGRATATAIDETVDPEPINPYAETKLAAESLLESYANGLETTALRLSTVYGDAPGIRFNLVVNAFVFRAVTGRPLTVHGVGRNWRPFCHVEDAARAFVHALVHPDRWPEHVYNVGADGENYRIEEVADTVKRVVDDGVEVTTQAHEDPGPSYHVSFDRLAETGFVLDWSLAEGVRDLAERFGARTTDRTTPRRRRTRD